MMGKEGGERETPGRIRTGTHICQRALNEEESDRSVFSLQLFGQKVGINQPADGAGWKAKRLPTL